MESDSYEYDLNYIMRVEFDTDVIGDAPSGSVNLCKEYAATDLRDRILELTREEEYEINTTDGRQSYINLEFKDIDLDTNAIIFMLNIDTIFDDRPMYYKDTEGWVYEEDRLSPDNIREFEDTIYDIVKDYTGEYIDYSYYDSTEIDPCTVTAYPVDVVISETLTETTQCSGIGQYKRSSIDILPELELNVEEIITED
jgi:hypothetical protein